MRDEVMKIVAFPHAELAYHGARIIGSLLKHMAHYAWGDDIGIEGDTEPHRRGGARTTVPVTGPEVVVDRAILQSGSAVQTV
jgi:hypothetical protein